MFLGLFYGWLPPIIRILVYALFTISLVYAIIKIFKL